MTHVMGISTTGVCYKGARNECKGGEKITNKPSGSAQGVETVRHEDLWRRKRSE